jgi:hypothetical protein
MTVEKTAHQTNKQRRQQVIYKHIVELETIINDDSNDPSALALIAMSDEERTQFLNQLSAIVIQDCFDKVGVNEGMSFAELRVAK